jgi:hypothetical protein
MDQIQETDGSRRDHGAHARFYKRAVPDKEKSKKEGREVCSVQDFVEILTPGDKTNIVDRPVRDEDKLRFGRQWAAYQTDAKADQDAASGTLLSAWGALPADRAEVYRFHKVATVEQLAGLNSTGLDNLAKDLGPEVRKDMERAKAFLSAARGNAPMLQLQSALDERDKRIAALEAALNMRPAEVVAPQPVRSPADEAPVAPRKRGRPSKAAQAQ